MNCFHAVCSKLFARNLVTLATRTDEYWMIRVKAVEGFCNWNIKGNERNIQKKVMCFLMVFGICV